MKKHSLLLLFAAIFLVCSLGESTAKTVKGTGVDVTGVSFTDKGSLTFTLKNQLSVEVSNVQAVLISSDNSGEENAGLLQSQQGHKIAPKESLQITLADADILKELLDKKQGSYKIIGCGTSNKPPSTGKAQTYTRAFPLPLSWGYSTPSNKRTETLSAVYIYLDLLQ
ncbi:hypothetical protein ACR42D_15015 [Desulfovibrio caledoniensis]